MKTLNTALLLILFMGSNACKAQQDLTELRKQVNTLVASQKSNIGFAMIHIERKDTLTVNNNMKFPMQSVYKFPLAMYILHLVDEGYLSLNRKVHITKQDVTPETWSPLKTKYPEGNVDLTVADLLFYSVSGSDNIACDLLFNLAKEPMQVTNYLKTLGYNDIILLSTEGEMHHNGLLQFKNTSSPFSMSQLLAGFYKQQYLSDSSNRFLMNLMTESTNSPKRIKGLLPTETIVAHKTGTGGEDENDIRSACNDVGIITLPNGEHIALTLFVTHSKEPFENDEKIMARLSKAVYDFYVGRK